MQKIAIIILLIACIPACSKNKAGDTKPPVETSTDAPQADAPQAKTLGVQKAMQVPDYTPWTGEDGQPVPFTFKATAPIAKVGDEEVSAEYFNYQIDRLNRAVPSALSEEVVEHYKNQLIQRLVDEHLIMQQARAKNVRVTEEELDAEMIAFRESFGLDAAFEMYQERGKVTDEEIRADVLKGMLMKKYFAQEHGVEVSLEETRAYYDSHIDEFTTPEEIRARHILFKVGSDATPEEDEAARAKAAEVTALARAEGADFAALAKEHSEGPTRHDGGDLGFFARNVMVAEFSDPAFALSPGEVSDPVKTPFGWHVIKLVERKEAKEQPFLTIAEKLQKDLFNRAVLEKYEGVVGDLKAKTEIIIHEEHIVSTK